MSKRLQVVMTEREWAACERVARSHGVTLSEWVRRTLREARRAQPKAAPSKKLAAIRAASQGSFPAPDVERMLFEIASGYEQGLD